MIYTRRYWRCRPRKRPARRSLAWEELGVILQLAPIVKGIVIWHVIFWPQPYARRRKPPPVATHWRQSLIAREKSLVWQWPMFNSERETSKVRDIPTKVASPITVRAPAERWRVNSGDSYVGAVGLQKSLLLRRTLAVLLGAMDGPILTSAGLIPSLNLTSYCKRKIASMSFISLTAKKRPGLIWDSFR